MGRNRVMTLALLIGWGRQRGRGGVRYRVQHDKFMNAFNNRQWDDVKSVLADDSRSCSRTT